MLELENSGGSSVLSMIINNEPDGLTNQWNIQARHEDSTFRIVNAVGTGEELTLSTHGDLTITGDLIANGTTYTSSINSKENFTSIDGKSILTKLATLPILKWNYKKHADNILHIGPMAEDFHQAFGLNGKATDRISISDVSGISLAAIKGLIQRTELQAQELEKLKVLLKNISTN